MLMSLAVALLTVASVAPQSPLILFPDGQVPGERPGQIGPESGTSTIYNVTVPTLTPYLATAPIGAAVIVAPGGAYKLLSWDLEGTDIAAWLNSIGIHAFILKYRVPARSWLPFGQAPFMDAQRAVGVLRNMAPTLQINVSRIGFMGFSAGGRKCRVHSPCPREDPADACWPQCAQT